MPDRDRREPTRSAATTPVTHHDALEFPDGQVVLLTRLCEGQHATVLQLPTSARPVTTEDAAAEAEIRERSLSI
jgi:hypothetical protein